MRKTILATLLSLILTPAFAQTSTPDTSISNVFPITSKEMPKVDSTGISYENAPDAQTIPALKPFRDRQARFFYMGRTAGLDGWFMMLPDKFVQIVYTSLDGKNLIVGFIVNESGRNITEQQMVNVRERETAVNQLFTDKVDDAKKRLQRDRGFQELMTNLNLDKPGDLMYAEMAQAPSIEVGGKDAPLLLMVVDPMCPFCKQAYKKLAKDYADKNKILLRIIPVGILGDDSMRMAELLLDKTGDNSLWLDFVNKDFSKDALKGTAEGNGKARYLVNAGLYNRWKLKGTPFFAYRSKSGGIKVLNEVPRDYEALVNDIAPPVKPKE